MKTQIETAKSKTNSIQIAKKSIENDIINGRLYPRQRLIEEEIAAKLGMSRTPVREALKQLEVEGWVTRLPTRGLIVTPITDDDIRQTFEVREALETMAIKLVCEKITNEALGQLKMYLDEHQKLVEKCLQENNYIIDPHWSILFHSELYLTCNNPKLIKYIESLRDIERLLYVSKYFKEPEYSLFHEQHANILKGIGERNQDKAQKAVIVHLTTMRQIYTQYIY